MNMNIHTILDRHIGNAISIRFNEIFLITSHMLHRSSVLNIPVELAVSVSVSVSVDEYRVNILQNTAIDVWIAFQELNVLLYCCDNDSSCCRTLIEHQSLYRNVPRNANIYTNLKGSNSLVKQLLNVHEWFVFIGQIIISRCIRVLTYIYE